MIIIIELTSNRVVERAEDGPEFFKHLPLPDYLSIGCMTIFLITTKTNRT